MIRGIVPIASQATRVREMLRVGGLMRANEFRARGITPATLSRMSAHGDVRRLGRGLYQLADAPVEDQHAVAEAAKRVPRGIVCLKSALAIHGLTDQSPKHVWLAIGRKDWAPKVDSPPIRTVRIAGNLLSRDVETRTIEGVEVRLFSSLRTVIDLFKFERAVGLSVAIEGLKELMHLKLAVPGEIASRAEELGVWTKMRPYVEIVASGAYSSRAIVPAYPRSEKQENKTLRGKS